MSIHIYNSLTKKKEGLKPIDGKTVRMYTCGVTVYDKCHIGHARSLYIFDIVRRYLTFRGYDVHFVRNITDIDDKIINRAKEVGKDAKALADEFVAEYYQDLESLGVDRADIEPRATDNIPDMIAHIEGLIKEGVAYHLDGDVYFSVRDCKDYGKLSGQSIEKLYDSVRIEHDPRKKDPLDFALWKSSADEEPGWDSPWGRGRPGWHIECSVMSMKHLKTQTLDIHAGGRDLIFPHHENEIAQSECLTHKPFANVWIHHGLLTINKQKMAKSLGNFITIRDAIDKFGVDELKLFFLSAHYASPIDFSEDKMVEMRKARERVRILTGKMEQEGVAPAKDLPPELTEWKEKFCAAMDDDMNTPKALAVLFDLVNWTNKIHGQDGQTLLSGSLALIQEIGGLLRLDFSPPGTDGDIGDDIRSLLEERAKARAGKDFKKSDEIRDALMKQGIVVEDTKEGQAWRKA